MSQIKAKLLLHTRSAITGVEALTWELEYPRFIHSELMTHRVFSRNSASSRAIPVTSTVQQVKDNPARPIHWGANQAGMQAKSEIENIPVAISFWDHAANSAAQQAMDLHSLGIHKQVVNRVLEPFVWMKVVVTSTEWKNWYNLRFHEDAQPEIKELARLMCHAQDHSKPITLYHNEWHLPYIDYSWDLDGVIYSSNDKILSVEDAKILSASLCAQVSYRKSDHTLEKANTIFKRLIDSEPVHASPVEHQLLVVNTGFENHEGWTHVDRWGNYWSGNIRGYVQWRQVIPNNVKRG